MTLITLAPADRVSKNAAPEKQNVHSLPRNKKKNKKMESLPGGQVKLHQINDNVCWIIR